ncbi:formate dehydrogenase accessory sulfurtransferase FdhD [Halobacillus sp. A1]|uniref:formate dehydrogenase accessory sulfurtransferase FdhD n=1 Tax=Halobacillus sp. A1 TaxID=2880262 RepID=UPI0020A62E2F|nr:formate dehydrogenase accessory sulfurtransferase FdhD [Halobacillus sp. A1]MCP3030593.1 formate dehydrogenase accessory sulfurtransferase FdhD [Halobacillus sp. A1]
MKRETRHISMIKYEDGKITHTDDEIAEEYPLTIMVNDEEFATMVCTPDHLEELVIGFLASEGVIRHVDDILSMHIDKGRGYAYITTHKQVNSTSSNKRWIGSCCGMSRAFYFQTDAKQAKTVMDDFKVKPEDCLNLMKAFQERASMFKKTGAVHQAAIASREGIELIFHDIGRHNALDKLNGFMIKNKISRKEKMVIFSGRISSEILIKVSKMRLGFLLSKSAPTDLAIELADDLNITAIGFARGNRMNIYTHSNRLLIEESTELDLN